MFGLFRKAPALGRSIVHPGTVGTPDLSQRPFTRALLRSATAAGARIQEEADQVGMPLDATAHASTDLDGEIASAVRLMTGEIVKVVLERLGRVNDFVPLSSRNRFPNEAPALMAYAALVTLALYAQVKREGSIVPLDFVMNGLAETIFFAWPKAQVNAVRKAGFKIYDLILDHKHSVMNALVEDVSKCVTFHIEQQGIEESKLKDVDTVYLLSRVFKRIADSAVVNR